MFVKQKFDRVALVLLVLVVVAYAAFQPRFHLRGEMPVEFFDPSGPRGSKKIDQRNLAEAYWGCAVKEIQWKYGYAHRLPEDPPVEFFLSSAQVGPEGDDATMRLHYWQKLRMVWNLPSAWETDYGFDLSSMKRSFQSAAGWLQYQMWRLTGQP